MKYLSAEMQDAIDGAIETQITEVLDAIAYKLENGEYEDREELLSRGMYFSDPDHYHDVSREVGGGFTSAIYSLLSGLAGDSKSSYNQELAKRLEELADNHTWETETFLSDTWVFLFNQHVSQILSGTDRDTLEAFLNRDGLYARSEVTPDDMMKSVYLTLALQPEDAPFFVKLRQRLEDLA